MMKEERAFRFRAGLLRATLAEHRIRQEQLGRAIGVRPGAVGRWCRERAEPRGHELVALASALGIPAEDFYEPGNGRGSEREAA